MQRHGRRRVFCTDACRVAFFLERKRLNGFLAQARALQAQNEIETSAHSEPGVPSPAELREIESLLTWRLAWFGGADADHEPPDPPDDR